MSVRPWRELVTPHSDVLRGTFQQSEFAADISRVHSGTATEEYQDPALFFQRTFITEGMKLLLHSVLQRLSGRGGGSCHPVADRLWWWQDPYTAGCLSPGHSHLSCE